MGVVKKWKQQADKMFMSTEADVLGSHFLEDMKWLYEEKQSCLKETNLPGNSEDLQRVSWVKAKISVTYTQAQTHICNILILSWKI